MRSLIQKEKERTSLTDSKWAYEGKVVSVKVETYEMEGKEKTFEIVKRGEAVVILPILEDGRILLIQQWRRAIHEIIIELPAGMLEKGEDPLACAKRELQEETGFSAKKIKPMGGFFSTPGFCDEYLHLFTAEDLESGPLPADDDEMIDLLPVTLKEAKHLIEENKIRDAKTVAGILKYYLKNSFLKNGDSPLR